MRHVPTLRVPRSPLRPALVVSVPVLLIGLLLAACAGSTSAGAAATPQPVTLNVFAAASLTDAFKELGGDFHTAHPNVTVTFSFGGSDTLVTQITQGAPADVFASAAAKQMDTAVKGGAVTGASAKTFAHNRLVVVLPAANPGGVKTLQDLARPGLKVDLAASTVPVGQYALDFLTKASADPTFGATYKANVLKNAVSYETDVKSVLNKIALGEADAGIVYTTDAATKNTGVTTIAIPDALNTVALYPIAPLKGSTNAAAAQQFVDYVISAQGQSVMAKYGFIGAGAGAQYAPPAGS